MLAEEPTILAEHAAAITRAPTPRRRRSRLARFLRERERRARFPLSLVFPRTARQAVSSCSRRSARNEDKSRPFAFSSLARKARRRRRFPRGGAFARWQLPLSLSFARFRSHVYFLITLSLSLSLSLFFFFSSTRLRAPGCAVTSERTATRASPSWRAPQSGTVSPSESTT